MLDPEHIGEQAAGLASARLLRHSIFGDPEHVAEPVAGLASARLLRHGLLGVREHVAEQAAELASARLLRQGYLLSGDLFTWPLPTTAIRILAILRHGLHRDHL